VSLMPPFLGKGREMKNADKFRVEIAVKQILCGMKIKVGASVMNKECLEWYREWAETH
jgi:hypothetical protein